MSASRSRPCLRPLQGGGSARQTTVLPRGESRHRRVVSVVELCRCDHGPRQGPLHGCAETRAFRAGGARACGQCSPRGRARPRPLQAAGRSTRNHAAATTFVMGLLPGARGVTGEALLSEIGVPMREQGPAASAGAPPRFYHSFKRPTDRRVLDMIERGSPVGLLPGGTRRPTFCKAAVMTSRGSSGSP